MQGHLQQNLYKLDCYTALLTSQSRFTFTVNYTQSLDLWHQQLTHVSVDVLWYIAKHNLITGMDLSTNGDLGPCDGCTKGKHPQVPFPKRSQNSTNNILHHFHMDLQGVKCGKTMEVTLGTPDIKSY